MPLARTYAAQLIGLMPDVILAETTVNLEAIRQATNTVPVVFVLVADPVTQGFVPSLRQPRGTITGFSFLEFSLGGKWVELLKAAVPELTRVSIMFNPDNLYPRFFLPTIGAAAASLDVEITATTVRTVAEVGANRTTNANMLSLCCEFVVRISQAGARPMVSKVRLSSSRSRT